MALSQSTISTAAWLPIRAVVLLIVPLRKSIVGKYSPYNKFTIILLPVSVGYSGQEPLCLLFACANLTRTLRKIQGIWNLQGSKLYVTINSMAYYHSRSIISIHIHSEFCLLKLIIPLQARGPTYQANNTQRNSSSISSRPSMLCNPFRCIFIFMFQLSTWFRACAKLTRT